MSEPWVRFTGVVQDGKLRISDRIRLDRTVSGWEGKKLEVAIRVEPHNRSLDQNAYLHVLAYAISEASGESVDRIKRLGVLESLGIEAGTEKEVILGKEVTIVRRTSELRKDEASKLIDWMLDKCAFLNVPVPKAEHVAVIA